MEMAHLRESNCIYDEAKYVMHAHGNDDMRETAHAFYPNAGSERARVATSEVSGSGPVRARPPS